MARMRLFLLLVTAGWFILLQSGPCILCPAKCCGGAHAPAPSPGVAAGRPCCRHVAETCPTPAGPGTTPNTKRCSGGNLSASCQCPQIPVAMTRAPEEHARTFPDSALCTARVPALLPSDTTARLIAADASPSCVRESIPTIVLRL
jgi:hypothetical protein